VGAAGGAGSAWPVTIPGRRAFVPWSSFGRSSRPACTIAGGFGLVGAAVTDHPELAGIVGTIASWAAVLPSPRSGRTR